MDTIIIKPKDKDEFHFFLELAKRLGADVKTYEEMQDQQLLLAMEENRSTPKISKQKVLDSIGLILNDKKAGYNKK
jgi:hypothetical protein